jgi:hypothetical protein
LLLATPSYQAPSVATARHCLVSTYQLLGYKLPASCLRSFQLLAWGGLVINSGNNYKKNLLATLFDNPRFLKEFIEYSLQDAIALRSALLPAQGLYLTKYDTDITQVFSTSTLSLTILLR